MGGKRKTAGSRVENAEQTKRTVARKRGRVRVRVRGIFWRWIGSIPLRFERVVCAALFHLLERTLLFGWTRDAS